MKDLTYDARDVLVIHLMDIITKQLNDVAPKLDTDLVWTDDVLDHIDEALEPFTTGTYENYN